jgi:hypothetical protein
METVLEFLIGLVGVVGGFTMETFAANPLTLLKPFP